MSSLSTHSIEIGAVSRSDAILALLREAIASAMPTAQFEHATPEATAKLNECPLIFIDATSDGAAAGEIARALRAGASRASLVFVVGAHDDALVERGARAGALEQIEVRMLGRSMANTIERAIGGDGWSEEMERARDEIRRTQRLLAAGEIALGLQHAMNNPLTAVLAEAQLLEMEPLPPETATAVRRIIESTRRLVALVRKLDSVSPKKGG
jgi:signal transduction histidine kinase